MDAQHPNGSAAERGPMDAIAARRRADGREDPSHRFFRIAESLFLPVQVTAGVPTTTFPAVTFPP
jgi:hypothetical protein